jgi:hypothetical protein
MNYTPIQPYSDELMTWNEEDEMYYITEEALIRKGINIRSRLALNKASSPEYVIEGIISDASNDIYGYIGEYSMNNYLQKGLIATVPSLRRKIYRALLEQANYNILQGRLSMSAEADKRTPNIYICTTARQILSETVEELGYSILYTGV